MADSGDLPAAEPVMTSSGADFFTINEVNLLKIT